VRRLRLLPARLLAARLSPERYRTLCSWALVALVTIVVTGAAVRLTGSGLGCTDWPTCSNDRLVAPLQFHPMVEFVNRLITGAVSIAVAAAVLGAIARRPRRRDLVWLASGLVAGVVGQILLGAALVLADLDPRFTIGHFLLSSALVADAVVLVHRASADGGDPRAHRLPVADRAARRLAGLALVLGTAVTITGTIVTGTGPHGGDTRAARLGFIVEDVARVHSLTVWSFLAVVVVLGLVLARREGPGARLRATRTVLLLAVTQGAIGYVQYFTGVPPLLVGVHVLGATLVWAACVRLALLVLGRWVPEPLPGGPVDDGDADRAHGGGDPEGQPEASLPVLSWG
jgi:cytochrome c oxidase assembly protein subunit 15